ncbi:hydrogen cyanide synthase HcnA [Pseudoalteromonas citrea]|uniref:Hydrogen cyanide synthase HcnA n=2 Tax=Pseudoalteromonas citrea TaxID=43655 RepID=A0AAD4FSF7_9GAMM|nr:hydrogen cyanide synthase HcnA [Pseudoalteromonas citrea]
MVNDHQGISGAYCGMGVCHCCHVKVNKRYKKRACQTVVKPQMVVETLTNRFSEEGIK